MSIIYWTLAYFILCVWTFVSLVVAIIKRHEEGMEIFAITLPMAFIGFWTSFNSVHFFFEFYGMFL